ncbi:MAG TPA: zinc ribbon domain-containing protein [Soehngenia sp.]|jgi:hypothetical protein|nr:zinc ribbon domain-containing protein [Soehngenia sp.]HPP31262.1 zinc ribbon domain-containing protein [Soehngenia sp.]
MSNEIPSSRKTLYYVGMILTIIGVILFLSNFVLVFTGNVFNVNPLISFIGFIMVAVGQIIRVIGAKGVAGSGIILDPEKAREDVKPYSKAMGGVIDDVLSNVDSTNVSKEIVKIKCRNCGELNDEDSVYCKSCGEKL